MKNIIIVLILSTVISCQSKDHGQQNQITIPKITVLDTDFSKGRLTLEHDINLQDLEHFHGHLCDGLVQGFLGIKAGMYVLYPNGIIDRTNTRIVSKSSPCLTDAAIYLTGGRYQYNSFYVDNTITNGFYIMQRIDNLKTVKIQMNLGVKPPEIDIMGAKAIKGTLSSCDLEILKALENQFAQHLLNTDSKTNFTVTELTNFKWNPLVKHDYTKTDILNKNKSICN
ncbi:formylmethanofuran dehydrogenase subunit E family protein [Winogradskyella undariae]|uniref:formylmethanofuran dehydrogenase subunit E family protein n=1 Tax=Winogradskyella undariae TaxID=1285465 RepID=UPI0015C6A7B9|nr:formylmethanofuran dehydrogenase subunit E family protein [Winogradskyella undariae]QNK78034.1 formylmethanofuran dehydrogenase subunit E family protein [Winogradskyella sp. PAMC22761]